MLTHTAPGDSRLSFWPRVREFAVPLPMIESATARRLVGDWAGACAAAGIDVDFSPRSVARTHGSELAARLRADLRHLAPDLLRWHLPRIAPDGLLRPGLTISLARYADAGREGPGPLHLVARTAPAWADSGQRISLALWDGSPAGPAASRHPHPHPRRRFRLDLHRHLWDVRRTDALRTRCGESGRRAVDRWAAEADLLLRADGLPPGPVVVRLGARQRLVLERYGGGVGPPHIAPAPSDGSVSALPVLPDAATWVPPDVELVRSGAIEVERLHPLVASALAPGCSATGPPPAVDRAGGPRPVECRGAAHRIGLVDGTLTALDHDPAEIRREELLAALSGTPLPCLQAIDTAHRDPACLTDVRERLRHGDTAGALAVVENLLGPAAVLRDGALRDELDGAARGRITYGLYRAGLLGPAPERVPPTRGHTPGRRTRPRRSDSRHSPLR
ncbi:hypothetical protein GKQ77_27950 [Streptomyces sp. BG9H]|uniref:Uncharacterized protein n=1 Tax=Streptomyces anatolicus TaxID=2675858 RepID=A0ABS6YV87_9ACTN|nr:hypothetical protein [Streptomyces anatolicus]MBW5425348.1 hypothetical protein [Streptomyces anatolicus]